MPFWKLREKMSQANKGLFWGSPGIVKNSIQPQNVWTQGNTWSSQGAQLAESLGCVHTATLLWPPFASYLVVINRQSLGLCSGHPTFFFRRAHPSLGFTHYLYWEMKKIDFFSGLQTLFNNCCAISPFGCLASPNSSAQSQNLASAHHTSPCPLTVTLSTVKDNSVLLSEQQTH